MPTRTAALQHAKNSSAPGDADQCCEHGRLIYPTISATILSLRDDRSPPYAGHRAVPPSIMTTTFAERVVWEATLKIPIRPFYTLTATYRI